MEKSLQCIVIHREELEIEHQLDADVLFLLKSVWKYGVRVLNLTEDWEKELSLAEQILKILEEAGYSPANALFIGAKDESLQAGCEAGLAVAAMKNPEFPGQSYEAADILIEGFEEVDFFFLERIYQRKHGIPWRVIETERCYLREMTLEDLDELYEIYGEEGIADYIEPLYERQEEEIYTKAYIQNMYGYYGYGMWLVFDRFTDKMIGRAGLNNQEIEGEIILEMGYLIRNEYQNQGYATEVCKAILDYAAEALEFPCVYCLVDSENEKSICFLHKMKFETAGEVFLQGKKMKRYVYFL